MAIPLWIWLNLLLLLFSATLVHGSDVVSEALLSFKSSLIDSTNSLQDWSLPTKREEASSSSFKIEACSWSGVTCNSNSTMLVALDLSRRGLSGPISALHFRVFVDLINLNLSVNSFSGSLPVEIFNLTKLKSLDISRNNFSGHFPSGTSSGSNSLAVLDAFSNSFSGPLPPELSQIETLKILNLAGSYFTGPIPPEYGSFQSLEFIHLAGNSLSGKIPPELGRLQTLTHMEIGYNTYIGGIPLQLGNMSGIQYLDIAGADLSGPIPPELGNLTKLESLFLFKNRLEGFIPEEFKNLVSLESLDLSDNHISGPIPDGFSQLKNLSLLSLFYNDMEGIVPQAIAELPMLKSLVLWNNFFTGSLPQSLGRSSKLELIDVSTNNFNGSIPPDICDGGMLSKIIIFSNKFSGEIPPSLSQCSSLVRLRLEDNLLSGQIPLEFASLPGISYVDLSMNKLTGGIPADISNSSKLEYFNVSNNPNLGGFVPLETWSLPNLRNFSASYCNIAGDLPSFQSCKSVSVIDLHSNLITGVIPYSVSNCQSLERIDLSHNNLNGVIPRNLGQSSTLLILNVSFNDISGSIPQGKVFSSMPTTAFIGNPNLCGLPLQSCSHSKEIQTEFTWILILCALIVVFIAAAVSGLFYFQRGRRNGQWKMVSFSGLPQFTPNDILKSFDSTECGPVYKAVLPTGITVLVKKIEWDVQGSTKEMLGFISQIGNARHKNLARLLGCCYNKHLAYLLYDYSPNGNLTEKISVKQDWPFKYKVVVGIAKGLWFLHHECYPAIPHGDFRTSNIVFDEGMEPQLSEFGFKFLLQLNSMSKTGQTDEVNAIIKEALYADVYSFGECVVEILMNGRMTNGGKSILNEPWETLVEEVKRENQATDGNGTNKNVADQEEEMKLVLEFALLCTRSRPLDRPSMEDALKILSGFKRSVKWSVQ